LTTYNNDVPDAAQDKNEKNNEALKQKVSDTKSKVVRNE
jgi:hypothetical protein